MSRKYKFHNQNGIYFISFAVVYWLDVFTRNEYKNILLDSWRYCIKEKGLDVYAWCIMTNHVHMIIGSSQDKLQNIVQNMKRYSAMEIRKAIDKNQQESRRAWLLWMMERAAKKNSNNNRFQFWQQHNKPIELFSNEVIQQKLDYIHNNPVEAGFVDSPEAYLYSSAKNYAGKKGLLQELILIE